VTETLADCAIVAGRVYEAQQWHWARNPRYQTPEDRELIVPDAERILEMLTGMVEYLYSDRRISWTAQGRLMVMRREDSIGVYQELGGLPQ
jgi:hypothetical protein